MFTQNSSKYFSLF